MLARPVAHSLSPVLHRAAYAALGLAGWTYTALECGAAELPALVLGSGPEWIGYSVSMPGKGAALAMAEEVGAPARAAGAANTLLRRADGGWRAENTDVHGIAAAVREAVAVPEDLRAHSVTVLGAGGTARAAVVALGGLGVRALTVAVRDPGRTTELEATAQRAGVVVRVIRLADAAGLDPGGLIVSALPPYAADALAGRPWSPGTVVLDAVYAPWPSELGRAVRAAGGTAVGGARILLHQAGEQVRLMTGRAAPLAAMEAALDRAVGR